MARFEQEKESDPMMALIYGSCFIAAMLLIRIILALFGV